MYIRMPVYTHVCTICICNKNYAYKNNYDVISGKAAITGRMAIVRRVETMGVRGHRPPNILAGGIIPVVIVMLNKNT